MKGIGIRLAIIAVIAIGAFIFRDRLSGSAGDLQVGDCFQAVTAAEVDDVQHVPCTDAHSAEVFYVGDFVTADDAPIPSDAEFEAFVEDKCTPALLAYVGGEGAFENPIFENLELNYFQPVSEGWERGDHEVSCWIGTSDGSTLSQSVKAK